MGIPRFFKLPEAKKFRYQPLYYDAEKERKEERNKRIARELGLNKDEVFSSSIQRGSFRSHLKRTRKSDKTSNVRLILIIIILFLISYFIFFR
jgi:hypothetical protein